eukprot:PhM_4_TR18767/c2_g1_i1/m.4349
MSFFLFTHNFFFHRNAFAATLCCCCCCCCLGRPLSYASRFSASTSTSYASVILRKYACSSDDRFMFLSGCIARALRLYTARISSVLAVRLTPSTSYAVRSWWKASPICAVLSPDAPNCFCMSLSVVRCPAAVVGVDPLAVRTKFVRKSSSCCFVTGGDARVADAVAVDLTSRLAKSRMSAVAAARCAGELPGTGDNATGDGVALNIMSKSSTGCLGFVADVVGDTLAGDTATGAKRSSSVCCADEPPAAVVVVLFCEDDAVVAVTVVVVVVGSSSSMSSRPIFVSVLRDKGKSAFLFNKVQKL